MSDYRDILRKKFEEQHRYANFGDVLMQIHVQGFRCHTDTIIEIQSPITAFCGLNGTGKSTLLQLAAVAYNNSVPDLDSYYIKDFIVMGTLDPTPFTAGASVEYRFWQHDHSLKQMTLSRNAQAKRWQGYERRPQRQVFFAGIGIYLPKIEKRDFIIRHANQLTISSSGLVDQQITNLTCQVLGHKYQSIHSHTVTHSHQKGQVLSVQRSGATYSEAHMGYGEGRSQYLIAKLERLPDKSLILIEEPETSLHPSAQHEFGRYLVDVSTRKNHQIMLTTHSEYILEALPSSARIYLNKTDTGVDPINGVKALQAISMMTQGHFKALHILVEDDCARAILTELIRRLDPLFLRSVGIYPAGDANTIGKIAVALQNTGLPVAAVRDGDKGEMPSQNTFKLPGSQAPEKELLANKLVKKYLQNTYQVNLDDFFTSLSNADHHQWFKDLAAYINIDKSTLVTEVARIYVASLPETDVFLLVKALKEAMQR